MRSDRIQKLNQLDFVWDAKEEAWDEKFQLLVEFQNIYKHTIVPQNHGRLGVWVRNQRSLYKAYLREDPNCQLTPERIQKLNSLEFSWDANEAKWLQKYNLLKNCLRFGNDAKEEQYSESLRQWIKKQRHSYKLNKLSSKRTKLLNKIHFTWDTSDYYWWKQYTNLQKFQRDHGHCSVPWDYEENLKLAHWVMNQRYKLRDVDRGGGGISLSYERFQALKKIGFWVPSEQEYCESSKSSNHY